MVNYDAEHTHQCQAIAYKSAKTHIYLGGWALLESIDEKEDFERRN